MPKITLTIVTEKTVTVSDETLKALLGNDPAVIHALRERKEKDYPWDEDMLHELQYRDQIWGEAVEKICEKYEGERNEDEFRKLFDDPQLYLGHGATHDTIPGVIHARYGTYGLFHR